MRKYVILRKPAVVANGRNVEVLGTTKKVPECVFERLTEATAASIAAEPEVQAIAPVMPTKLIRPLAAASENASTWGLDAVGARNSSFTGSGVTIAILDTGIDATHPAFTGLAIEQRDFSGDGDGDCDGHGTHCAGIIFGRDVANLRIGVAPGVQRALVAKVLGNTGSGDAEMIVEGVRWAMARGANIISLSLGFDFPGMVKTWTDDNWPVDLATSNALEAYRVNLRVFDAMMNLTRALGGLGGGALVIAAAGNESKRGDHPQWRIAASLPAAAEDVVSVAAVGQTGHLLSVADFSNSMALVSGPGVGVISARAGGGLVALSGTSMACPHVAGVAALWSEAISKSGRTATPTNIRSQLIANAQRTCFSSAEEIDVGQGLVTGP